MNYIKTRITAFILLVFGVSLNLVALDYDDWRTPPGKLYDIGGYRLHMYCEGAGDPTIIMDAGIGGFSLEWIPVQRLLRTETFRVCIYDRAGYGWSDPGPPPRTTDHIVEELHILLSKAEIKPPYILVGHSFGGYNMQYFARSFPAEVSGLVLVDSSHPDQVERLPDLPSRRGHSSTGEMVTLYGGQPNFQYYPEDIRDKLLRILSLRKIYVTHRRESVNFALSGDQVNHAGTMPEIPLLVITRGLRVWPRDPYGDMLEFTWTELQKELVQLNHSGKQIIADKSNHLIHLLQPDLVAAAIRQIASENYPVQQTKLVESSCEQKKVHC